MALEAAELTGVTRNPAPNGAVVGYFESRGGLPLRYARWDTTAERRIGTVCLFQGRREFIEKYFETITDLRRRGFAVATMDWRGQGGSARLLKSRLKCHAESFAHFDEDVRRFMTGIVLPDCPPPYYCLAHSLGAHLVLRLAQTRVCWWDRMVLTSPMIQFSGSELACSLRSVAAEACTLAGAGDAFIPGGKARSLEERPFANNPLTSDRLRFERAHEMLRAAPHLAVGSPTIGWVAAACASIKTINAREFTERVKVPVLIVAAGNDAMVSTAAIERFASRLKNCALIVIAGAKHEILQERDQFREQFWAAFDAFVPGSTLLPRRMEQPEIAR
jgi:lysophospholipase